MLDYSSKSSLAIVPAAPPLETNEKTRPYHKTRSQRSRTFFLELASRLREVICPPVDMTQSCDHQYVELFRGQAFQTHSLRNRIAFQASSSSPSLSIPSSASSPSFSPFNFFDGEPSSVTSTLAFPLPRVCLAPLSFAAAAFLVVAFFDASAASSSLSPVPAFLRLPPPRAGAAVVAFFPPAAPSPPDVVF